MATSEPIPTPIQNLSRSCTHNDLSDERARKWQRDRHNYREYLASFGDDENARTASQTQIGIPIVYRILYHRSEENISIDLIKAQHDELNRCFNAKNTDLALLPDTGNYAFIKNTLVNELGVGAVFIPEDSDKITDNTPSVTRNETSKSEHSLASAMEFVPPIVGWLNVYISNLRSGLLGEAQLGSNVCIVTYGSVGSLNIPGDPVFTPFNFGRTMVHEIGHCFGELHPFDSNCIFQIADLPKTKTPNTHFTLSPIVGGGNHERDLESLSVDASCSGNNPSGFFEAGCVFMDYANDKGMNLFSTGECSQMYVWLTTEGMEIMSLTNDNFNTFPPQETPPDLGPDSSDGLSATTIALIVLGSLILAGLIAWGIYAGVKSKKG